MAFEDMVMNRGKGPKATKWDDKSSMKKKMKRGTEDENPLEFTDKTDSKGFKDNRGWD